MTIEHFDQTLAHGITLSCRGHGEHDAAQRVLLLHGFPEGAFVWDEVMQQLSDSVRCVAPNLRGYERSSAPVAVEALSREAPGKRYRGADRPGRCPDRSTGGA